MARKRKAQPALPVVEEAEPGSSKPNGKVDCDTVMLDSSQDAEAQVHAIVKECKAKVESKAEELIEAARQRVQQLRADSEAAFSRIPKQVRNTSAVEFFALTPEETAASTLRKVLLRLQALQQGNSDAADMVAANLIAVDAAGAAQPTNAVPKAVTNEGAEQQTSASMHVQQEPQQGMDRVQPQKEKPQNEQPQAQEQAQDYVQKDKQQQQPPTTQHKPQQQDPCCIASAQDSASSPSKLARTAALMLPPPPRIPLAMANPPARPAMANEVLYSANGSPIIVGQLAPPGTLAMGTIQSLSDVTPAAGASCAAAVPTTLAFTGRTFRRAAPTRGRIKQPTRAITVTTHDGKHFTVDDLIGMAGVPQAYRDEVRRLVEADLQDLNTLVQSVATLEQSAANATSVTASTSRPTRRR